jgi:hypothetical protein
MDQERQFLGKVKDIIREIERHKWLESEKAGHDIGGNRAAMDWLEHHYDQWKRNKGYA